MKIGKEVYVHGYIDEIRNGVIIIRNKGGYFGTEPEEVFPSAQPERKKGKWIHDNPNSFKCSRCNKYLDIGCGNMKMNFCPNCGADMRGNSDDV